MWSRLARRNVLLDRRRFATSALGVAFALALVLVQLGLFTGLAANATQVIDRSPGDVWITGRNTGNFQWGQPIPRRSLDVVRSTPGIDWARELVTGWTQLRHPDGGVQRLEVIGFDLQSRVGAPWNVVAGDARDLAVPGRVALDATSRGKLGHFSLGDHREIGRRRVRIAAVTHGITSFTTIPFVFASLDTAREITGTIGADETVYVVAGLAPDASLEAALDALRGRLPHLDVYARQAFRERTRRYWMFETGMGIGFLLTSMLAVCVGAVIVSQTLYAATSEHLPEYGTLKAMGATDADLTSIVVRQALIAGAAGCVPGALIGAVVVRGIRAQGLEALLGPGLVAIAAGIALGACVLAALGSIRRVRTLEPAMVFRL